MSQVTGNRLDIFISPSKILCGQDVLSTHIFLQALSASISVPKDKIARAVQYVLDEGDSNLYKRGVRTRKGFTSLQAICRGWRARRYEIIAGKQTIIEASAQLNEDDADSENSISSPALADITTNLIEPQMHEASQSAGPGNCNDMISDSKSEDENMVESYQAVIARKLEVEEELKVAEEKLKVENNRLLRILNLGATHKKSLASSHSAPKSHLRPPLSAPHVSITSNTLKRISIKRQDGHISVDETFSDKITNFSALQSNLKKKERRLNERESRLKQKLTGSKHKEEELKIQEERISDLAEKIRRQQLQLKEQKLQFERSKALKPPTPPNTSRPCAMCTEKEIQSREMKGKIRERMRVLSKRETYVIEKAHELRRKEIQLAKLERELSSHESSTEDLISELQTSPSHHQHRDQNKNKNKNVEKGHKMNNIPNLHRRKAARKRRRSSGESEENISTNSNYLDEPRVDEGNLTRNSFGDRVPTIVEETNSACDENEEFSEKDNRNVQKPSGSNCVVIENAAGAKGAKISDDKNDEKVKPHQMTQPVNVLKNLRTSEKTARTPVPSPKQRHVFTFEKKVLQEKRLSAKSNTRMSDIGKRDELATPDQDRGRKSKVSHDKHDDWISSFDVQMKCAMNRLKELV